MIKVTGPWGLAGEQTWEVDGGTLTITRKKKSTSIPLDKVQTCNHKPPGLQGRGKIEVQLMKTATAGLHVGGGLALAFGNEPELFVYTRENSDKALELYNAITNYQPQAQTVVNEQSSADELLKFKGLLDSGVITQEEFDAKKKQLLGL